MSKATPDVDTTGLSIDGERPLAEALRKAMRQAQHDRACSDPSGWYPERCTCWVREAREALAEHDAVLAIIAERQAAARARR